MKNATQDTGASVMLTAQPRNRLTRRQERILGIVGGLCLVMVSLFALTYLRL